MHAAVVCFSSAIAQLGLTATILVLVRYQLQGLSPVAVDGKLALVETCYLSLAADWPGACTYAEVAASVSLALTLAYFVLQLCATMRASNLTSSSSISISSKLVPRRLHAAQVLVLLIGIIWWLAAACTLQYFTIRANQAGLVRVRSRAVVLACCWGSLGLFALLAASELLPTALAHIAAFHSLPPPPPPPQQLGWQHPGEVQLGPLGHQAAASAAAAVAQGGPRRAPASFPAATAPSVFGRQQQQHQGIVMGIPCVPAGSAHSMPQLPLHGEGPAAIQAALFMRGGWYASGAGSQAMRMLSLQPPAPAAYAWGAASGSRTLGDDQGVAGRTIVVNPSV